MFNNNDIIIPTFAHRSTVSFPASATIARRALREYDKIRESLQSADCNGLAGMIGICMTRGLHDSRDICRALMHPPFAYAEPDVENLLKVHAGNDPRHHFWYVDAHGLYHLHANRRLGRLQYSMKSLAEAA